MADAQTVERIIHELEQIRSVVEELTGLPSRWNGTVELVPDAPFYGLKPFRCTIILDAGLASEEVRWRTLIHELLHAVSVGYNFPDYDAYPGWEEGVVEGLQRRLRRRILSRIGVDVEENVFAGAEKDHSFNRYIAALESIRSPLGQAGDEFYLSLLRTPIRDRYRFLMQQGMSQEGELRRLLIAKLSAARPILEERLR